MSPPFFVSSNHDSNYVKRIGCFKVYLRRGETKRFMLRKAILSKGTNPDGNEIHIYVVDEVNRRYLKNFKRRAKLIKILLDSSV